MIDMEKKKKIRIGALDVFIVLALAACVVGLGLRVFSRSEAVENSTAVMKNYTVDFEVCNIRGSSVNYFNVGDVFFCSEDTARLTFLKEGNVRLGELVSRSDMLAQKYYTDINGNTVLVMNEATDDMTKRIDLDGRLLVSGIRDADGRFLVNGQKYLGVNKEVEIKSKYITVNVRITAIEEAASEAADKT